MAYTKGSKNRKTAKGVKESLKDKLNPMKKERVLAGLEASSGMKTGGRAGYKFGKSVGENKYPSKGMNKLASKNPKVAKKIMGYKKGGKA
jgi:hypothetical protein